MTTHTKRVLLAAIASVALFSTFAQASPVVFSDLRTIESLLEAQSPQGQQTKADDGTQWTHEKEALYKERFIRNSIRHRMFRRAYSWYLLFDSSPSNPLVSPAITEIREKNPECVLRYILEVWNDDLSNIKDEAFRSRVMSDFVRGGLAPFDSPEKTAGLLEGTKSENLGHFDPFLKSGSEFIAQLQANDPTNRVKIFEKARSCAQPLDVGQSFTWFDYEAILQAVSQNPSDWFAESNLRSKLKNFFSTTFVPNIPHHSGWAYAYHPELGLHVKEYAFDRNDKEKKKSKQELDLFTKVFWNLVPEAGFKTGYFNAKSCTDILPYVSFASLFGMNVTGNWADIGVDNAIYKKWMGILVNLNSAADADKSDDCSAALRFTQALWPESYLLGDYSLAYPNFYDEAVKRAKTNSAFEFYGGPGVGIRVPVVKWVKDKGFDSPSTDVFTPEINVETAF